MTEEIDKDEQKVIAAFRKVRQSEFGDVIVKVHNKKLVAIYVTNKWHAQEAMPLREPAIGGRS